MLPGLPKLDHRGPFLGLGSDEFAQIRRRAWIRHAPQRRVPRSHIRIGQDRIDPDVELLDDLDWRALRRADAPRCAGLVTRHEFANGRQLGERPGACGRRHRQGPATGQPCAPGATDRLAPARSAKQPADVAAPAARFKKVRRGSFVLPSQRRRAIFVAAPYVNEELIFAVSIGFDIGGPDRLAPLFGLVGDDLAEVGG